MESDGKNDRLNRIETAICIVEQYFLIAMREEAEGYLETKKIEDRIVHECNVPHEKRLYQFPSEVPAICKRDGMRIIARHLAGLLNEKRNRLIELFDEILFGSNGEHSDS